MSDETELPLTMDQVKRLAPLLGEKIDRLSAGGEQPISREEAIQVAIVDTMLVCTIADPDEFMARWEQALIDATARTILPADQVVTKKPSDVYWEDSVGNRFWTPPTRRMLRRARRQSMRKDPG